MLDLQIPAPNGVEVTAEVLQQDPSARVLILSASGEQDDVLDAVKAGATGYLVKSASSAELLDAVRRVAAGDTVFTPGLAGLVLGEFRRMLDAPAVRRRRDQPGSPSARPRCSGWSRRACPTSRSPSGWCSRTAPCRTTCRTPCASSSCNNRVQLTRYAIEQGLDGDE